MEKREHNDQIILRLSDDEKYFFDIKCKNSQYKNKNDHLRHLILCGYTYCVDRSELRDYNVDLSKISRNDIKISVQESIKIYL